MTHTATPPAVADAAAADPKRAAFIQEYFRHLPEEDLPGTAEEAGSIVDTHIRLGRQRELGTSKVRVFNPRIRFEDSQSVTVVDIVNDDMPHLVDAVVGTLAAAGVRVFRVQHPILVVQRDADGVLQDVRGGPHQIARGTNQDCIKESWMHVLIDRLSDAERAEAIEQRIMDALDDVRAIARDGAAMMSAVRDLASMVRAEHAAVTGSSQAESETDSGDRSETADLLDWLADGNMVLIGYRRDTVETGGTLAAVGGAGLGVYRESSPSAAAFDDESVTPASGDGRLLTISQATRNAVITSAVTPLSIAVRLAGTEHRLLGVLLPRAMNADLSGVPLLRRTVGTVLQTLGADPDSYTGQRAIDLLSGYPRAELFWAQPDRVAAMVGEVLHGSSRRRLRAFLQPDPFGRFVAVMVFLARDRWTTGNRFKLQDVLLDELHGTDIRYNARVGQAELAAVQFVVTTAPDAPVDVDPVALSVKLREALRDWDDDLVGAVVGGDVGNDEELDTAGALARYSDAFDEGYKEDYSGQDAVEDLQRLDALTGPQDLGLSISVPEGSSEIDRRLKLYVAGTTISLSRAFPILQSMGAEVIDERPYNVQRGDGTPCYIYDFGLAFADEDLPDRANIDESRRRFSDAFIAAWRGDAETDGFNKLVLTAGLTWRQIAMLRAYAHYLQQIGSTYTQGYIEQVLAQNPVVTADLAELFAVRFDPDVIDGQQRSDAETAIVERITGALDEVSSLDADRILRSLLQLISGTDRTNAYRSDQSGTLAFKLDPTRIPGVPKPVPVHEIWVYSPKVEGVHLRFGDVARGGLRWSDRPEDFRTEILGLVKAQEVKNAVIVPVGAKGGFVVRRPPAGTGDPAADREAQLAEGISCYRAFISALLDVTDNRVSGELSPPPMVVRHDGDDPYLVVAADKGTATFSDIANSVAADYGFWLDDAFASGGSAGYDHKGMGITARGAWESVKHHFRELGVDTQAQEFTVVGVGDMSGDVFGNGMLLSDQLRLVAAFDHRHVFVDPDPVAGPSYAERRRLFDLPRSSWADYDSSLISAGGGIWPRSAKSIPISDAMRRALGMAPTVTKLSPVDLIRAILLAPVDLLWNGGIGTYVKAATETHAGVGDKANDPVRVDGRELRVKVIGEGGNLGITQLGRIEFARAGGRVNTDAIDNSAGVDTSDHEVNIKIALQSEVAEGRLTVDGRNEFLASMTDEVGALVLADNTTQNRLLGVSRCHAIQMLSVHQRLIAALVDEGRLDRALEYLPDDEEINARIAAGEGLSSPELSVLIAYVKSSASRAVLASELPDDPAFATMLPEYFPTAMAGRYAEAITAHPLSREIVTTMTANDVVNGAGISYIFRVQEETAASITDAIRAYRLTTTVFGLPQLWADIAARDNRIPAAAQDTLQLEARRLLDRAARWFLARRPQPLDVSGEIERYASVVAGLTVKMPELLRGVEHDNVVRDTQSMVAAGADIQLARRVAYNLYTFSLLDVVDVALETGRQPQETAEVYYALSEHLDLDRMLSQVTNLERGDRWHALARQAVRDDLYRSMRMLTADVLSTTTPGQDAADKIAQWETENASRLARARTTLTEIAQSAAGDLAALSVAAREVRSMIR
jgi:glutamate dehydrogenase